MNRFDATIGSWQSWAARYLVGMIGLMIVGAFFGRWDIAAPLGVYGMWSYIELTRCKL